MFGQDNQNNDDQDTATIQPATDEVVAADGTLATDSGTTADVSEPVSEDTSTDTEETETPAEVEVTTDEPAEATPTDDTPATESTSEAPAAPVADDALLDIKKEALSDLAPLVDHLDQTPEEHFKTIMMLIQATDDSSYVKAAYDSAKKISDDDERAQALLDIVNEINYFTQAHNASDEA